MSIIYHQVVEIATYSTTSRLKKKTLLAPAPIGRGKAWLEGENDPAPERRALRGRCRLVN